MLTVYKYPFQIEDLVEIQLPRGTWILHVEAQDSMPCLWALVDPEAELEARRFAIYGTGHPMAPALHSYVGTFQHLGTFVWHVFEVVGEAPEAAVAA